jgi:heme exporter protein CcmD
MQFQFESLQGMLEMSGHGEYVWTAVLVSLLVMACLLVKPLQQHQDSLRAIARQHRREQQRQTTTEAC